MSLISVGCFLLCGLIVAAGLRRGADVLSPARITGFIWSLAVGLADLKLSRLQHEWSTVSWMVVLMGPIALLTGLFIAYVIHIRSPFQQVDVIREKWRSQPVYENRLYWAILALFGLFLVGYLGILLAGREVPIFAERPGLARLKFQIFGIGLFLHNVLVQVFLTVVYVLRVRGNRARKAVLSFTTFLAVMLYGITLQRFQLIMSFILCVVLLYYVSRHLRFGTVSMYVVGATAFFLTISTLRGGQLFIYYLYKQSEMTFSPNLAMVTEPYMYLVMNLENLTRGVDHLQQFSHGYFTFDFAWAITGLKHWMQEYFAIDDSPFLNSGYNTYSMFWDFYRDFGFAGVSFLPLLMGFTIGNIYAGMRRHPSLPNVTAYAVCAFVLLFSFFMNFVSMLWFVYDVIALILVIRLVRLPEPSWLPSPATSPLDADHRQ